MARKLHDIQPGEVSLVHRGANKRRFLLAKSEEFEFEETVAKILNEPAEGEDALLDAVRKAGGDEEVLLAAAAYARVREALPEAVLKAMAKKPAADTEDNEDVLDGGSDEDTEGENENEDEELKKSAQEYESLLKRDFSTDQRKDLASNGAALPNGSYPIENVADLKNAIHAVGRGKSPHAEIRAHIVKRAKALGAEAQLPADWTVNKAQEDDMSEAAMPVKKEDGWDLSGVSDETRVAVEAVIKAQEDEVAELRKAAEVEKSKADEAIEIAKAERSERETRDYIAKSAGYENLAKADDEFGPVLKSIANAERDGSLPEGTAAKLDEVLKAADEQVAKGALFAEAGRAGHGGNTDSEGKAKAAAAEIKKADPKLTDAQALAKAYEADGSLYDEYLKEVA